jgi:hypothetical protein
MTTFLRNLNPIPLVFIILVSLVVSACSSDEDNSSQSTKTSSTPTFDHAHGDDVTDLEKHKFEHKFANQCVAREIKNSVNKAYDKKRLEKTCLCIASYMMKDLTAVEAEKFLEENKNTRSLQIRFDNAAYQCLQKNKMPKAPEIFKTR